MRVVFITVGSRSSPEIASLCAEYERRLPQYIQLSWVFIPHGAGDPASSKQQEAEAILRKLPEKAWTILLDEAGRELNSQQHAELVFNTSHATVAYIIGGAYGVAPQVRERVDFTLSLSKMVFPHQLVRLILSEQFYRAYTISVGHPYHH